MKTEKPCSRCGKCCTNESYMLTLQATAEDIERWTAERRWDILQYAVVLGSGADLWISPRTGEEMPRCPFVRKDRGKNTYTCTIHDTKPEICREYVPWHEGSVCEDVL